MATTKSKTGRNAKTAPKGMDHKQQSALQHGGSLAQRTGSDPTGPEADIPDEITSSSPPNVKETGRASSPMFDEQPAGGKEANEDTAKKPVSQVVKAGAATDTPEAAPKTLEDLPAGSTIDVRAGEVVIHAAVAGGSRRTFHGKTFAEALAALNKFSTDGPALLPTGRTKEEDKEHKAQLKQNDKDAAERAKEAAKAAE